MKSAPSHSVPLIPLPPHPHPFPFHLSAGIGVSSVHPLLDTPVALAVFYPETSVPRVPAVAVAAGTFVFVYRNLRPYLKFTLPQVPMTPAEVDALAAYGTQPQPATVTAAAAAASSSSLPAGAGSGEAPPMKHTVVTCLDSIPRDRDGDGEQSSLVVGTEAGQLLFLDAAGSSIERCVQLPSVPVHMVVHGTLKGDHRINISCRDGVVYAVRDRELLATRIEPPALPSAIVRTGAYIYVASVDSRITGYEPAGKKVFTLPLPKPVTALARMCVKRDRTHDCVAVALEGGEVRVYNGDVQVASMQCPDTVVAMRFGQYGREANTLILASRSGALTFKMLKRTATFEVTEEHHKTGPPPEQDIPLAVPKKTRLYLDQTQRERDGASDMYRVFQRDLTRLRLTTARAYVKVLTDGGSTAGGATGSSSSSSSSLSSSSSSSVDASLRINCTVQGLGPRFTIRLDVQNAGTVSLPDLLLAVTFDKGIYHMDTPMQALPMLLPVRRGRCCLSQSPPSLLTPPTRSSPPRLAERPVRVRGPHHLHQPHGRCGQRADPHPQGPVLVAVGRRVEQHVRGRAHCDGGVGNAAVAADARGLRRRGLEGTLIYFRFCRA